MSEILCKLYSECTLSQSKKALVNHGHSFLFAEDFSIVAATVSLRCDLTSIAHNPTGTIKTMRDCANDNDNDNDDDRRESKDMVWQEERMTLGEVMMTNSERWQAPSPLTA